MGEFSKIEWTDHTFNPWVGCQKVSPGCDHCYAEGWAKRSGMVEWGPHGERKRTSEANWKKPLKWAKEANDRRPRVFCASLADWLDNQVPYGWRLDLALLVEATPELDWLLLTKRIENWQKLSPWAADEKLPDNVWLGITCEDQPHYDRRWPILRSIPAKVRFISYEPALGPLTTMTCEGSPDWIICGGESGPGRRPFDMQWARDIEADCAINGVAFFMKQIDKVRPVPPDLMVREFPSPHLFNSPSQRGMGAG